MVNHVIGLDEQIQLRLIRPGVREKRALRDVFEQLQPVMPLLRFLGDIAAARPDMQDKDFVLSQTGISVPLRDVIKLLVLLERVERELLPKE